MWKLVIVLIMTTQGGVPAQSVFVSEFRTESGCKRAELALRETGQAANRSGVLQGVRLFSGSHCVYDGDGAAPSDQKERL